jgi:hypothetical protein
VVRDLCERRAYGPILPLHRDRVRRQRCAGRPATTNTPTCSASASTGASANSTSRAWHEDPDRVGVPAETYAAMPATASEAAAVDRRMARSMPLAAVARQPPGATARAVIVLPPSADRDCWSIFSPSYRTSDASSAAQRGRIRAQNAARLRISVRRLLIAARVAPGDPRDLSASRRPSGQADPAGSPASFTSAAPRRSLVSPPGPPRNPLIRQRLHQLAVRDEAGRPGPSPQPRW